MGRFRNSPYHYSDFCESTPAKIDRALPKDCDWGCKKNSKGKVETWKGYKLHILTMEGNIPLSAVLTSASVHESQATPSLLKRGDQNVESALQLDRWGL